MLSNYILAFFQNNNVPIFFYKIKTKFNSLKYLTRLNNKVKTC